MKEIYELTLKQYQNEKMKEFKKSYYWKKYLKVKKEIRDNAIKDKMQQFKLEWHDAIIEYGTNNILDNKVIYSFDNEYGREYLLHVFRGTHKALEGWVNSDAIKF